MDQDAIIQYIAHTFAGVDVLRPTDGPGAGDTFFIYDPERNLDDKRRLPFATIVTKDYGEFDNTSQLNRADVFRLNIGVNRDTFRTLFGARAGGTEEPDNSNSNSNSSSSSDYDYAALDRLMPHPVYASQSWVCVLNPTPKTFESIKPLLAEAYAIVVAREAARQARHG